MESPSHLVYVFKNEIVVGQRVSMCFARGQIPLACFHFNLEKKKMRISFRGRDPEGEEREEGEIFTTKISYYIKQGRDWLPASSCNTIGNQGV